MGRLTLRALLTVGFTSACASGPPYTQQPSQVLGHPSLLRQLPARLQWPYYPPAVMCVGTGDWQRASRRFTNIRDLDGLQEAELSDRDTRWIKLSECHTGDQPWQTLPADAVGIVVVSTVFHLGPNPLETSGHKIVLEVRIKGAPTETFVCDVSLTDGAYALQTCAEGRGW
jgi:hypothetical protein